MRMTEARRAVWILIPMLFLTASCSPGGNSGGASVRAAEQANGTPKESLGVAKSVKLDSRSKSTSSTKDAFRRLTPQQRDVVAKFYDQFGSTVFDFNTVSQHEWMMEHGYPMPEDVLAAQALSANQLLENYYAGDVKAGYFYVARRASAADAAELNPQEVQQLDRVVREVLGAGSPFGGYVYYHYQMQVKRDPIAAFAGLAWADTAGDSRAALELAEMVELVERRHPGSVPPASLLLAYKSLLNRVSMQQPELLTRRWQPYPYGDG